MSDWTILCGSLEARLPGEYWNIDDRALIAHKTAAQGSFQGSTLPESDGPEPGEEMDFKRFAPGVEPRFARNETSGEDVRGNEARLRE